MMEEVKRREMKLLLYYGDDVSCCLIICSVFEYRVMWMKKLIMVSSVVIDD